MADALTEAQLDAAVAAFADGDGLKRIANDLGTSAYHVKRGLGSRGVNYLRKPPVAPPDELRRMHWDDNMTVAAMAKQLGTSRLSLVFAMDAYGIPMRSVSEDNKRRYAGMSGEQIRAQTRAANEAVLDSTRDLAYKRRRALGVQAKHKLSTAETIAAADLERAGVAGWGTQHAFDIYNLDIAFPDLLVAIEVDGGNWHQSMPKAYKEVARERFLASHGWHVLHLRQPAAGRLSVDRVLLPTLVELGTDAHLLLSALCRLWS
jgi:very-short-patch-repair endonuclease